MGEKVSISSIAELIFENLVSLPSRGCTPPGTDLHEPLVREL